MRVGFIGLGTMGASIAHNVIKGGFQLTVHDVRPDAAEAHLALGADWADSPSAVAQASDVVFTSLPGPKEVEAVVLGEDGLSEGMSAGSAYFDLSTNSPTVVRRIHAALSSYCSRRTTTAPREAHAHRPAVHSLSTLRTAASCVPPATM